MERAPVDDLRGKNAVRGENMAVVRQWRTAVAAAGDELLRHAIVKVPADSSGWIDSGIDVNAGESLTLLSSGSASLADGSGLSFGASTLLCHRLRPSGQVTKFAAAGTTFTAAAKGRLELVVNFPGAWVDRSGGLDAAWPRQAAVGTFHVAVLVWRGSVDDGLALFAAMDRSGLAIEERSRVRSPARLPKGWQPLWRVGPTDVYRESFTSPESPCIACRCAGDGGIITYPVDVALDHSTRLGWSWRMIELPSKVNEDVTPTHDYLSIAVEFDNGLDLTYLWSAALPVGAFFRCPFPWWNERETHQVIRRGEADLGRWQEEEQPILADYERAIGGQPPLRIVDVWLIGVAILQGGRGECEYRKITLKGETATVFIGP